MTSESPLLLKSAWLLDMCPSTLLLSPKWHGTMNSQHGLAISMPMLSWRSSHPSQPQPPWSHTFIKISERNKGNPLFAHLGLYLHAEGTTTIIDSPAARDKVVHPELCWSPEQAPSLFRVINLIIKVHIYQEEYWGWYKSCHILAAAILDAVYDVFDGAPETHKTHSFVHQPYSFCMNYAARIAKRACNLYRMMGKFFW